MTEELVQKLRSELISKKRIYIPALPGKRKGYWRRDDRRKKMELRSSFKRKKKDEGGGWRRKGKKKDLRTRKDKKQQKRTERRNAVLQQMARENGPTDVKLEAAKARAHPKTHGKLTTDAEGPRTIHPKVDSMALHQDANGNWDPERQKLHEQIIDHFLEGVPKSDNPTVTFMGGGPASGKSSIEEYPEVGIPDYRGKKGVDGPGTAVLVNADDVKKMLPEMEEMTKAGDLTAAGFVHEESSYLSKVIAQRAIDQGLDVHYDGTGDSGIEKLTKKVSDLRTRGHKVKAIYVTVPTDVAIERSNARAGTPLYEGSPFGRLVEENIVRGTHETVSDVFPKAVEAGVFDDFQLWDTSGPKSTKPTLVVQGNGNHLSVLDPEKWDEFKGKATPIKKAEDAPTPEKTPDVERPTFDQLNTMARFAIKEMDFKETKLPEHLRQIYERIVENTKQIKERGQVPYVPND